MMFVVVNERRIHRPRFPEDWPRRQPGKKRRSFTDECQAVAFQDEPLHIDGMRHARMFLHLDSGFRKQFKEPLMGRGMPRWIVKDAGPSTEIGWPYCRFCHCQRIVGAETGHEAVTPKQLNAQIRRIGGQRDQRGVDLSFNDLGCQLRGVREAVVNLAGRQVAFVNAASGVEQIRIDPRSASQAQVLNLASVDGFHSPDHFVSQVEQKGRHFNERFARFGRIQAVVFAELV